MYSRGLNLAVTCWRITSLRKLTLVVLKSLVEQRNCLSEMRRLNDLPKYAIDSLHKNYDNNFFRFSLIAAPISSVEAEPFISLVFNPPSNVFATASSTALASSSIPKL